MNPLKSIPIKMSAEREAEVYIYEEIGQDFWTGSGITAKGFAEQLDALGPVDSITVRINSPGGSVFDGNAIYNALVRHPAKVKVEIDGIAASAASYIAMAGDEINIAENGMVMVHRAHGGCMGNCQDMIEMADVLEKLDGSIAKIYADRTNRKLDTWLAKMDAETWFTADEAVKERLADSITPNKDKRSIVARFGREVWNRGASKHPERIAALLKLDSQPENATEPEPTTEPAIDVDVMLASYNARAEVVANG